MAASVLLLPAALSGIRPQVSTGTRPFTRAPAPFRKEYEMIAQGVVGREGMPFGRSPAVVRASYERT